MYGFVHFCSLWWKQSINCHFKINVLKTNKTNFDSLNTLVYVCYIMHSNDINEFCRWLERWHINHFEKIIFKWKTSFVHCPQQKGYAYIILNWLKYTLTIHACVMWKTWALKMHMILILRENVPNIHTDTFTSNFWLLPLLCENNFNWVYFFYVSFLLFFLYGLLELTLFVYN